jgi:RNase P subunit RPR2
VAYRAALQIGRRVVLAMTCWRCGHLLPGDVFDRYARRRGQRAYVDRRCRECRWRHMTDPAKRGNYADRFSLEVS